MGLTLNLLGTHYHLNLVLLGEGGIFLSLGRSDMKIVDKSWSEPQQCGFKN